MPLADIARSGVVTADRDATAVSLAETLEDNNVGSVVITEGSTPVGIVTDRDLAVEVLAGNLDPQETTAADLMSADLVTANEADGTFELCSTMCNEGVRRMPIVDGDGDLVGIVTFDDMLQFLADELQHLASVVAMESPPY